MAAPQVVQAGSLSDHGGPRKQEQHPPHPQGPLFGTRDEEKHKRLDRHKHEIRRDEDVVQRWAREAAALQERKEVRQDESDSKNGQPHLPVNLH